MPINTEKPPQIAHPTSLLLLLKELEMSPPQAAAQATSNAVTVKPHGKT
jgi:hypothetical protein